MGDRVYLAWNLPNWITVILMAALGYLLLAVIMQGLQRGGFGFGNGGLTAGGVPGASLIFGGGTAGVARVA